MFSRAYRNSWTLDASIGCWTLDAGLWTLDPELWMLNAGRWTVDVKTVKLPKTLETMRIYINYFIFEFIIDEDPSSFKVLKSIYTVYPFQANVLFLTT